MQFFLLNKFYQFLRLFTFVNIIFIILLNVTHCTGSFLENSEGVFSNENNISENKDVDKKEEWTEFDRNIAKTFLFVVSLYFTYQFFDFFIDWLDKYFDPNWPFGIVPEPDYLNMPYRIGPEGKVNFVRLNADIAKYYELLKHDIDTWGQVGRAETALGRGFNRDGSIGGMGNISPSFYYFFQVAENYNVYPWALSKIFNHWPELHEIYDCETIYEYTLHIYGNARSSYFPSFYTDDLSTYKASSRHPDATL